MSTTPPQTKGAGYNFALIYTLLLVAGNGYCILRSLQEGGWAAMGLLMLAAPIYNGILLVAGIIRTAIASHRNPAAATGSMWTMVILLPVAMTAFGLLLLFTGLMPTGGC